MTDLTITQNQIKMIVSASEVANDQEPYSLGHAGTANSGYSLGYFQTDLSEHTVQADKFVGVLENSGQFTSIEMKTIKNEIEEKGRFNLKTGTLASKINAVLNTTTGTNFVNSLDKPQLKDLVDYTKQVVEAAQLNPRYATEPVFKETVQSAAFQALVASNINQYGPPKTLKNLLAGENVVVNSQNVRIDPDRPFTIESFMRYESHYKMVSDPVVGGATLMRNRRINEIENLRTKGLLTQERADELTKAANTYYHPVGYRVAAERLEKEGLDASTAGLTDAMAKTYHLQGFTPTQAGKHMADQLGERGAGAASAELGMTLEEARTFHAISNGATPTALRLSGNLRVSAERLQNDLKKGISPQKARRDALDVRAESRKYNGPSTEYSPEDTQTVAQNQAQLARNTQILKDQRAANLLTQGVSLNVSPSSQKVNSVTIQGVPKGATLSAGTINQPAAPQPKRTVDFAKIARALNGRPRSLLDTKTVEDKNYAGPSQEYSAEDFQSVAQNRAQLNTQTEIKAAMNTPAYRESAHPDFKKTRKEIADAWAGYTERREQTKRDQIKQDKNDLQGQTSPTSTITGKGGDVVPSNAPPSKQVTLGQKDVLGEATRRAKTMGGLLDNDPTQPSNIDRVMGRMAASQRAKDIREKDFSWQDRSWSTMSSYDQSRAISAEKARRRGTARSKNAHTPSGTNAYGEKTTGGTGTLGRGGQLSKVGTQKAKANQKNRAANKDGSYTLDADGNGAGNAGGTVICTELYHQSLLPLDVFMADQRYGLWIEKNDPYVMIGYHFFAKPIVSLMQNSKLFTRILFKTVAEPWAREMVVKSGNNGLGSARGKALFALGLPICRWVGRMLVLLKKISEKSSSMPFS